MSIQAAQRKDGKLRAFRDCVLFLQAQKLGLVVLTANVSDYDILLQLIPTERAVPPPEVSLRLSLFGDALVWQKPRDGLFGADWFRSAGGRWRKIDQSLAIVVESALDAKRANFSLKSKAENFDGSPVGVMPSGERLLSYNSTRYDD